MCTDSLIFQEPPRSVISAPPPVPKKPPLTSKPQDNTQTPPAVESGQSKFKHPIKIAELIYVPLQQISCFENHPCALL